MSEVAKLSLTEEQLKDIRDAVLYAHRIAICMLRPFCPYGRHMFP